MIDVEASTLIDRPVDEVFTFATDPMNISKWQFDTLEAEYVTQGSIGVGSRFRAVAKFMGRRELDAEVTEREPNRIYQFKIHSGPPFGLRPLITHRFEPSDGGTKYSRRVEMQATGLGRVMEPMMRSVAGKYNRRFLDELKKILER